MTKPLLACLLICFLTSCTFTTENKGQLFVNQDLLEREIRSVQPAKEIGMSVQKTNGSDPVLIIKLEVDPKIPDDSLNGNKAKLVLASIITAASDLNRFTSCKIVFIRKTGSVVSTSKSIAFECPITPQLLTNLVNYKDSTRASVGYIDSGWTYINKDLNLSLPLKKNWYYISEEQDSLVYYAIGSDVNQLPQYCTDTDRKVSFKTLSSMVPGQARPLLRIGKYNALSPTMQKGKFNIQGAVFSMGMLFNRFNSEDEYLNDVIELLHSKELVTKEIRSYHFGNADFRGLQFSNTLKNGITRRQLAVIKQFRSVSLVLGINFSNEKELEEIKQALSGLKIE